MIFMDLDAMAFLARVTKALVEQPNCELGLSGLMDEINQYFSTEAASFFVLDESHNELVLKYAAGPVSQKILGLRIPLGQGVVGWATQFNEPLIVPLPGLDSRFCSSVDEQSGFVTRSILCVPVTQADRNLGAIELLNKVTGPFIDDDVALLQDLASAFADICTNL